MGPTCVRWVPASVLAWRNCVSWPAELACIRLASWLAGMVMMVIFSPAFAPAAGSTEGIAWITSLGGGPPDEPPMVRGPPAVEVVVKMGEEFNVTWPSELVMTMGMVRMDLQGKHNKT